MDRVSNPPPTPARECLGTSMAYKTRGGGGANAFFFFFLHCFVVVFVLHLLHFFCIVCIYGIWECHARSAKFWIPANTRTLVLAPFHKPP